MTEIEPLSPEHGGYRRLKSFQRGLPVWDRNDPRRQDLIDRRCTTVAEVVDWVRKEHGREGSGPGGQLGRSGPSKQSATSTTSTSTYPELAANAALILLTVACRLLDRQLAALAEAFKSEGGFTERLYRLRLERRKAHPSSRRPTAPTRSKPKNNEEEGR
jgi:four helix bundle suffix protein